MLFVPFNKYRMKPFVRETHKAYTDTQMVTHGHRYRCRYMLDSQTHKQKVKDTGSMK